MSDDTELVRMQMLLTSADRELLAEEARRRNVSMSEVVRRLVQTLREEAAAYDMDPRGEDPCSVSSG